MNTTIDPATISLSGNHKCQDCHGPTGHASRVRCTECIEDFVSSKGLDPLEAFPGRTQQWRLQCSACGREVVTTFRNIERSMTGCTHCGRELNAQVQRAKFADDAIAEMKANGLTPLDEYRGTHTPWRCRCECGAEVVAVLHRIKRGYRACKGCTR